MASGANTSEVYYLTNLIFTHLPLTFCCETNSSEWYLLRILPGVILAVERDVTLTFSTVDFVSLLWLRCEIQYVFYNM